MIAEPSSPYVVTTTTSSGYTYFQIKRSFEGTKLDTNIYAGSNQIDDLYIGNTKIKQVWIGEDIYYDSTQSGTTYVSGSKYKFTYCTFRRDGTKYYSNTDYGTQIGGGTLSVGFILVPELLYRINDDGTLSQGSASNLSLDLYHMGTKLYRASVSKGYMYYLNEYLVAIYNKTPNECSISTYFGSEVPSLLLQNEYLDPWHLTFVCPFNISQCVDQNTNTSTGDNGPSTIISNNIDITISSSLDPVLLKDTINPPAVF